MRGSLCSSKFSGTMKCISLDVKEIQLLVCLLRVPYIALKLNAKRMPERGKTYLKSTTDSNILKWAHSYWSWTETSATH